jgi:hypothetical protein
VADHPLRLVAVEGVEEPAGDDHHAVLERGADGGGVDGGGVEQHHPQRWNAGQRWRFPDFALAA